MLMPEATSRVTGRLVVPALVATRIEPRYSLPAASPVGFAVTFT